MKWAPPYKAGIVFGSKNGSPCFCRKKNSGSKGDLFIFIFGSFKEVFLECFGNYPPFPPWEEFFSALWEKWVCASMRQQAVISILIKRIPAIATPSVSQAVSQSGLNNTCLLAYHILTSGGAVQVMHDCAWGDFFSMLQCFLLQLKSGIFFAFFPLSPCCQTPLCQSTSHFWYCYTLKHTKAKEGRPFLCILCNWSELADRQIFSWRLWEFHPPACMGCCNTLVKLHLYNRR